MSKPRSMNKTPPTNMSHPTVESSRSDHRALAQELLSTVLKRQKENKHAKPTFRIGLSGSPGVGKSTFIEVRPFNNRALMT